MKTGYKKTVSKKGMAKGYESDMPMTTNLSINESMLPDIKDWKVGDEYEVMLTVKMTGLHKMYSSDKLCADFEVTEAETSEESPDKEND